MAANFAARWRQKMRALGLDVSPFVSCGMWLLPQEAPPLLRFERAASPAALWDIYNANSAWSPAERERFAAFRVIGSFGTDNPICLVERTVVLLESQFQESVFMNRGIPELAECLLAYLGESDPDKFREAVLAVDPLALTDGAFWKCESDRLGKGS